MSNYIMVPTKPISPEIIAKQEVLVYVPIATTNTYGTVKPGNGLLISNGVLTLDSTTVFFTDKVDKFQGITNLGKTLIVNNDGYLELQYPPGSIVTKLNSNIVTTDTRIFDFQEHFNVTETTSNEIRIKLSDSVISLINEKLSISSAGSAAYKDVGLNEGDIPELGTDGKLPTAVIPASAITNTQVFSNEDDMLAWSDAGVGDVAIRTDITTTFILQQTPSSVLSNWIEILTPIDGVISVNGQTGVVSITPTNLNVYTKPEVDEMLENIPLASTDLTDSNVLLRKTDFMGSANVPIMYEISEQMSYVTDSVAVASYYATWNDDYERVTSGKDVIIFKINTDDLVLTRPSQSPYYPILNLSTSIKNTLSTLQENITTITDNFSNYVPVTRTINSKPLSSDITLNLTDFSGSNLLMVKNAYDTSDNGFMTTLIPPYVVNNGVSVNSFYKTRYFDADGTENFMQKYQALFSINTDDFTLSGEGTVVPLLNLSDTIKNTITSNTQKFNDYVPITRTINGKALNANIVLTNDDVNALSNTTVLADLTQDSTHRTVTDAEKTLWNSKTSLTDIPNASTETRGLIYIATDTEADSGTNETKAINPKQLKTAIDGLGTVFDLKGSVSTIGDLPSSGNEIGDVWYVTSENVGYIWLNDGTTDRWEQLGLPIDLSGYVPTSRIIAGYNLENNITVANLKNSLDITDLENLVNSFYNSDSKSLFVTNVSANNINAGDTLVVNGINVMDKFNALDSNIALKVPQTTSINGKPLSSDITLTYTDVGALSDDTTHLPNPNVLKILKNGVLEGSYDGSSEYSLNIETGSDITVDSTLSKTSTNPIQNAAITNNAFLLGSNGSTTIVSDINSTDYIKVGNYHGINSTNAPENIGSFIMQVMSNVDYDDPVQYSCIRHIISLSYGNVEYWQQVIKTGDIISYGEWLKNPSYSDIPDSLADLTQDSNHRTVTDSEKSTWNNKQNTLTAGTGISISPDNVISSTGNVTVDSTLSTTSTNPVQNKVITSELNTTVKLTGNQTIDGIKNFTSIPRVNSVDVITADDVYNTVSDGIPNPVASGAVYDYIQQQGFLTSAPVTSVAGQTGAVTTTELINAILTGAVNYGDKIIAKSISSNGYIRYASGLCIEWGMVADQNKNNGITNITFPVSFSRVPSVTFTWRKNDLTTREWNIYKAVSTTGFSIRKNAYDTGGDSYYYWHAIGYKS